ncbi:MAG: hypothetical protein ACLP05_11665 [Candidatus Kryptoniota bacterium]
MTNEIINLTANVALTLSFIVAVVFGIAQVKAAARERRERLTLETLRSYQTREFSELMLYISSHDMPTSQSEFQALPTGDKIISFQFAQEMESLGILVAERIIDIDLVDKTLGSFVMTAWSKYRAMYLDIREKLPDPFLGEYFQWLAERINERMQENPRKPYHETHR